MRAVLSNVQHPEYGVATIPLPIPNEEYDHVMELLGAMELGDVVERDCKVEEIQGGLPILKRLEKVAVNIDELDYLAKRLDSFDYIEAAQFQAMAVKTGVFDMKDLINLTFCCQQSTVITDFSDLEAIGRHHLVSINGGCLSSELADTDLRMTALKLILSKEGTVTPYGVVYDNGLKLDEVYDGRHLPGYHYEQDMLAAGISSRAEPENTSKITWLYLPCNQIQIERGMMRSGISDPDNMRIWYEDSQLPTEVENALEFKHESIYELNDLAAAIKKLTEADQKKLGAAVILAEPECASQIRHLAENLDQFEFAPNVKTPKECSARIFGVYLKYIAPEDIHSYSIDEVFIDATNYLSSYKMTARELAMTMILDVLETTGITATAGIGTNLYLCKVAMDIVAKHIKPDKYGVRIAKLDEMSYRRLLWDHRPLTDFWRVGRGYARKLEAHGLYTMGDIAQCSIGKTTDYYNEELLYKLFGINAELLIDHAWGWEPCTIDQIKAYKPSSNSIASGQVLQSPYSWEKARLVVREMTDMLSLDLVDKGQVTDQLILTIGYDIENLKDPNIRKDYHGAVTTDHYGRAIPKHATGTANLGRHTASTKLLTQAVLELYGRITDPKLLVRRISISANHVVSEKDAPKNDAAEQLDLFTDYAAKQQKQAEEEAELAREKKMQETMLTIKKRFGKNAILKGMNLEDGATARERNSQIGGHRA